MRNIFKWEKHLFIMKIEFDDFEVFNVECQKLDNFNFSNKISFIKIDVEGHETEGDKRIRKKL